VSWVTYRLPDGSHYTWESRRHRKSAAAHLFYADRAGLRTTRTGESVSTASPWRRFWAPHRLAWWVAVVFVVGSALFIAGAAVSLVPELFGEEHRKPIVAESCYFVGALLFTASIYGQLLESINADERIGPDRETGTPARFRWFITALADLGRLAVLTPLVLLVGSLVFNYETTVALGGGLGLVPRSAVWISSLIGAIFFLLASLLQFVEAGHRYLSVSVRDVSWWIGVLFILGSIGFILGAMPGLATPGLPSAEHFHRKLIIKSCFFAGGLAYLVGSYLMLPELFTHIRRRSSTRTPPESKRRTAAGRAQQEPA
jgi:hypothetical protein